MFENIMNFFKNWNKKNDKSIASSKDAAKERLHLVLMQDRANVSADFLELMKQEIIEVIKKYIDVDESAIDVRLTNKENGDGTNGAPALYANIPILNIKNEARKIGPEDEEKQVIPGRTIPASMHTYEFLDKDSMIQCEEIRAVSKARLDANRGCIGTLTPEDFNLVKGKFKRAYNL